MPVRASLQIASPHLHSGEAEFFVFPSVNWHLAVECGLLSVGTLGPRTHVPPLSDAKQNIPESNGDVQSADPQRQGASLATDPKRYLHFGPTAHVPVSPKQYGRSTVQSRLLPHEHTGAAPSSAVLFFNPDWSPHGVERPQAGSPRAEADTVQVRPELDASQISLPHIHASCDDTCGRLPS